VGPRAVDTFAGPKRHGMNQEERATVNPSSSTSASATDRQRRVPTAWRQHRTPCLFPPSLQSPNTPRGNSQFNGSLLPHFLLIKKSAKTQNAKTRARAVPLPCLRAYFFDTNPSSKRGSFSGRQGLLFRFDLAGSLALKIDWRINVSEAMYGKEACGTMRHSSIYRPETTKLHGVILKYSLSEGVKKR
jgi:hypothetical protein